LEVIKTIQSLILQYPNAFSEIKLWFTKMKVNHSICDPHEDCHNFWFAKAFRLDIAVLNQCVYIFFKQNALNQRIWHDEIYHGKSGISH